MSVSTNKEQIAALLSRGVDEIIGKEDLEKKLQSGKQLRIKLGIDPTSPHLHLGRSIPLLKLRDFQELGHKIVFIIGNFTGVIGDTSDKDSERPMLEDNTIAHNMKEYAAQAGKIIDLDQCEVRYNSEWLSSLTYGEIGRQANAFSVAEFIARDNIKRRLDDGKRVSLREMLYPLMQGYDSVAVQADVELGGTDQRFNLLAGRVLQQEYKQEPQAIIMGPLVEGTDGRKMSSSWGNTINVTESPNEMFGKVMSIQDELIIKYFSLMTRVPMELVQQYAQDMKEGANPKEYKMKLGFELVRFYHSEEAAHLANAYFIDTFANKQIPTEMPLIRPQNYKLIPTLVESGLAKSTSDALRLISGGGIKVNGKKVFPFVPVSEFNEDGSVPGYDLKPGDTVQNLEPGDIIQKGKRFFVRIT